MSLFLPIQKNSISIFTIKNTTIKIELQIARFESTGQCVWYPSFWKKQLDSLGYPNPPFLFIFFLRVTNAGTNVKMPI